MRRFKDLDLPAGERLIWQGRPSAKALALRVFHVRLVALYFAALFVVRIAMGVFEGQRLGEAFFVASRLAVPLCIALALLAGLAALYGATTRYSITNRRILLQFGAVLPMTLNIPFGQVASAALKDYADGSGELPLSVTSETRLAYLLLWPHVRPWQLTQVEPMLRCVPQARDVAELLAGALKAASPQAPEPVTAAMPVLLPPAPAPAVATAA